MPYYHSREELLEQFVEQKERRRVKTLLERPTHTVNTSRCLEATVKGWIRIKSLLHES